MTGLSLNRWLAIMGFHPWLSYQLTNSLIPVVADCQRLVCEYNWQAADRAGRSEIRRAIQRAENLVRQYAKFAPSPRFQETTMRYPELGNTMFSRYADIGSDGRWLSVVLPEGQIRALGIESDSSAVTALLIYSDDDGDGLYETATTTAAVPSGTTADQVVARFVQSDCGSQAPPEVAPRLVTIDSVNNVATVVFDTWTLVRPVRYTSAVVGGMDPGNNAAPAATVCAQSIDIFRRRTDPTGTTTDTAMAVLTWETRPWPDWGACCSFSTSSQDPAATATALARCVIRDAKAGTVAFGEAAYDSTAQVWRSVCDWNRCRPPDSITIRYQAGLPLDGIQMREDWAIVVARLAAAELARPICACTSANKELAEWQKDLTQTGATDDLYQAPEDATNPLGSRRGQVSAWRSIQQQQRTIGIYAG
jgi:hypothetical protein